MSPALLDISNELLDIVIDGLPEHHITKHFKREDVKQLRLVCQELEKRTRIRFGKEFFFRLVARIVPGGLDTAQHILDDAIFRESVCSLDIEIGPKLPPLQFDRVMPSRNGTFAADFARVVTHPPSSLKSLSIKSPCAPEGASIKIFKMIHHGFYKVITDFLQAISSSKELQLDNLSLGCGYVPGKQIPAVPMALDLLLLPTINWLDLLTIAPKLRDLEYDGRGSMFPGMYSIPSSLRDHPTLQRLSLGDLALTKNVLVEGLERCHATLTILCLADIRLAQGTWREVFHYLREYMYLGFVELMDLEQAELYVSLEPIIRQRPTVVDLENITDSEPWENAILAMRPPPMVEADDEAARGKELEELLADDWILVVHNTRGMRIVELDDEQGDNLDEWLAILEAQHQLI
ncbi:hypothetical protein HBI70_153810 [Parastagonospora nodorum]|nr:hypothetical protein HBI06_114900 [Parastagonospora nodorum]KAH4247156.1 hypothetical protein HBI05_041550 [Parastagonospora nodorum]KAH5262354.1 hypothetical protein HBI70_153810 [Parastagonospora nodorum]KAH5386789.1 hypothetical protein HBI33_070230 [Parastagonospora nodorum]